MSEQARLKDQSNLITLLSDFTDDEPDTRVFHVSLFPLLDGWQLVRGEVGFTSGDGVPGKSKYIL